MTPGRGETREAAELLRLEGREGRGEEREVARGRRNRGPEGADAAEVDHGRTGVPRAAPTSTLPGWHLSLTQPRNRVSKGGGA